MKSSVVVVLVGRRQIPIQLIDERRQAQPSRHIGRLPTADRECREPEVAHDHDQGEPERQARTDRRARHKLPDSRRHAGRHENRKHRVDEPHLRIDDEEGGRWAHERRQGGTDSCNKSSISDRADEKSHDNAADQRRPAPKEPTAAGQPRRPTSPRCTPAARRLLATRARTRSTAVLGQRAPPKAEHLGYQPDSRRLPGATASASGGISCLDTHSTAPRSTRR